MHFHKCTCQKGRYLLLLFFLFFLDISDSEIHVNVHQHFRVDTLSYHANNNYIDRVLFKMYIVWMVSRDQCKRIRSCALRLYPIPCNLADLTSIIANITPCPRGKDSNLINVLMGYEIIFYRWLVPTLINFVITVLNRLEHREKSVNSISSNLDYIFSWLEPYLFYLKKYEFYHSVDFIQNLYNLIAQK